MPRLLDIAAVTDATPVASLARQVRAALRRIGIVVVVRLGFLAELGWAVFGSLHLGLGTRPLAAGKAVVVLWLAGAGALAALVGVAAWLAAPEPRQPD